MTEFEIESVKKVIINDLIQEDLETFLYTCRIGNTVSAIWVDGIIIILVLTPSSFTETGVKMHADGIRIYEQVIFVKYPKYTKTIKWNGGTYELALRSYKNFPRFKEFAKWIKSQPEWAMTPETTS